MHSTLLFTLANAISTFLPQPAKRLATVFSALFIQPFGKGYYILACPVPCAIVKGFNCYCLPWTEQPSAIQRRSTKSSKVNFCFLTF